MGGEATIFGYSRPPIILDKDVGAPGVDHRLDGDHQAGRQPPPLPRLPVVRDVGLLVHLVADPVAHELADDRVAVGLGVRLDGPADVAQPVARDADRDGPFQRLAGDPHQGPGRPG